MRHGRPSHPPLVVAALAVLVLTAACSGGGPSGPPPSAPPPVEVAQAETREIPIQIRAIGAVEAYATVEVRAQVGGVLERVGLERGQAVRPGDVLFEIDDRPFQAALSAAEARLARDRALARNARQDVTRYKDLVEKDYVTREQYDAIMANAEALEASVAADEAAVDNARLELAYCTIASPIAGRAGDVLVHAGNVVKANADNPLAVLLQTRPILVSFAVPERHLSTIRARFAGERLAVTARPPDGNPGDAASEGRLTFIDNTVDPGTGTIGLKATFPNTDERLWPGQFVDVVLTLGQEAGVVVVPTPAVQRGQEGTFVYVLKEDRTVELRPVQAEREFNGFTVVTQGVAAGETVVTDGQLRLVPGVKVETRSKP